MSKFVLEKAVEKTKFVLEKKNVKDIKAHVVVDLDVSGSTQSMYQQGLFQKAFQQVLPIGIIFDDNQEIDTFTFSNGNMVAHVEPNASKDNYEDYIQKHILNNPNIRKWGGTDYSSVLQANVDEFNFKRIAQVEKSGLFGLFKKTVTEEKYFPTAESGYPVIVFFFTDGENDDKQATFNFLESCQSNGLRIYFQFIGIGYGDFNFLRDVAEKFDNTGFVHMQEFEKSVDEDKMTDLLLSDELCEYLKSK